MTAPIGLVDCNNFYASCERLFQPDLRGKPVVVLSNGDGCVIARSNEAKALGIAMGEAWHLCRARMDTKDVIVRSSNYVLYGDLSARVMRILAYHTPELEIYSIDEAFLGLGGFGPSLEAHARRLRQTVQQSTGLPVSIGIAPTKTLAFYGVVLSTLSDKHSWAFAYKSRTHGLDQTNWDGVTFRDKWRSSSSACRPPVPGCLDGPGTYFDPGEAR